MSESAHMAEKRKLEIIKYMGVSKELIKDAGDFTLQSLKVSQAFFPVTRLLVQKEDVTVGQLSLALNELFDTLYNHPLTSHGRRFTEYLRRKNVIPNEQTTERLIRYVVDQIVLRSPVPVPKPVVDEFWLFFNELMKEPELKGLFELNLDIIRLLLAAYEPLLVEIINLLKDAARINRSLVDEIVGRVRIIRGDLVIIKRQIKALRYIKPFFQTDPKDFKSQARIVANMVREFGPFFIKMAQVAAANSDFLPREISRELTVFQEDAPPMRPEEVIQAFEEVIGKAPWECYFDFNVEQPIKSGSIGSVYLAKKPVKVHGREVLVPVIVKIGRFGLDREFLMGKTVLGMAILSSHYWAPHSRIAPFLESMHKQVDEFCSGFQQELDFECEADVQRRFYKRSRFSSIWKVPDVYFASSRIMEMEYVKDGMNILNAIHLLPAGRREDVSRQTASKLLYTILFHVFVYQELHGDLHPGNIIISPDGKIHLIDWANCINMAGKWKPMWDYLAGALSANADLLTDALINISSDPEYQQRRRMEIRNTLQDTLRKKNVKPLTKYFIFQLRIEGMKGLQRRFQVVMHMVSNSQQLGLTVRSEYLHLSRSLAAVVGTYILLYEGMPRLTPVFDFFKTLSQFPYEMVKDRLEVKRAMVYRSVVNNVMSVFSFLVPEMSRRR